MTLYVPQVRLRVAGGGVVTITPPTVIGRMATAGLNLDDPRISEAHLLISWRDGGISAISLRGSVILADRPGEVDDLPLQRGQILLLGGVVRLEVLDVLQPESLLCLVDLQTTREYALKHHQYSLNVDGDGQIDVTVGILPEAEGHVYFDGGDFWLKARTEAKRERLCDGSIHTIASARIQVRVLTEKTLTQRTKIISPSPKCSTRIAVREQLGHVWISASGTAPGTITGLPGRLFATLARVRCASRDQLIAVLWGTSDLKHKLDPADKRENWYKLLSSLKSRLAELGAPDDLVESKNGVVNLQVPDDVSIQFE